MKTKRKGPLIQKALPVLRGLGSPGSSQQQARLLSLLRFPNQPNREAKLLKSYFFLVFFVAFFFIVLLSLGLDFDLAAALPGFLLTGIRTPPLGSAAVG
jgi:hypothetical protein